MVATLRTIAARTLLLETSSSEYFKKWAYKQMALAQAPACLAGELAGSDLRPISGVGFEHNRVKRREFRLVDNYSVILLWLRPFLVIDEDITFPKEFSPRWWSHYSSPYHGIVWGKGAKSWQEEAGEAYDLSLEQLRDLSKGLLPD